MVNTGERYERFTVTRQEKQKLQLALEGYFSKETMPEKIRGEYEKYLRKRIRPVLRRLMEEEDTLAMEMLWEQGFYEEKILDSFLKEARDKGFLACMVCLLRIKQRDIGFRREEWEI